MNPTQLQKIRSRVRGCFVGVAIGDALGMPWETMSPEEILAATNNEGVTDFSEPQQTRVKDTASLAAGSTTDDWQLTAVVAESLVATKGKFDLRNCSFLHVVALASGEFGWGRGTRTAIEQIRDGLRDPATPLPPPKPGEGCGNGVVMKVSPLAVASALAGTPRGVTADADDLLHDCLTLGGLTHPDPAASVAAYAVARLLRHLLLGGGEGDMWEVGHLRADIMCATVGAEKIHGLPGVVSDALDESWKGEGARPYYASALAKKRGFCGPESAATAIALFSQSQMRCPDAGNRFRPTVAKAVNLGGDTDTNASIVGALIGAQLGDELIPVEWRSFRDEFGEAAILADRLCDACV